MSGIGQRFIVAGYETVKPLIDVDIFPVSDLGVHVWHVCEQTAHSWIIHKYNYNVIETHSYVEHLYGDKMMCIERTKHLKKQ